MRLKPLQLLGRPIKRDPHLIGLPNKSNGLSASRGDLGGRSAHRPQTGAPGPLKPLQPLGGPIKGEPHHAQSPKETAAAPSDKSNNRGSWRASQSFFGMCPPAFSTSWILRFILPTPFWTKRRGNDIAVCFGRRRVDKSTQKGRWKIKCAAASEGKKNATILKQPA